MRDLWLGFEGREDIPQLGGYADTAGLGIVDDVPSLLHWLPFGLAGIQVDVGIDQAFLSISTTVPSTGCGCEKSAMPTLIFTSLLPEALAMREPTTPKRA